MSDPLVLAIDQGTSSTKTIIVDADGSVVARGSAPLALRTPQSGWVEHHADDVIDSVRQAVREAAGQVPSAQIVAVGISNQRESLLLWDRVTGEAISPVLSWQDRRTAALCEQLEHAGHADRVFDISGLPLDPMFSAVKAAWLIDSFDPTRSGRYALGTVDSWLAWKLTGRHVIEMGNASRTSLLDISTGTWSPELLDIFGIPANSLPEVVPSTGTLGSITALDGVLDGTPVTGILGDSHAALFAHAGWRPGVVKVTYGTGTSVMGLAVESEVDGRGLCRTIAWSLPGSQPAVAWEANILSTGATLTWLAGVLGLAPGELADLAASDSGGVALVPAFNGLGAPWWSREAQAVLVGMSLATTREHLARAALDSTVLQVADVLDSFGAAGVEVASLVADGGASDNLSLMGRQAGLVGHPIQVSAEPGLSAMGAAHIAGLGVGLWSLDDLSRLPREYVSVLPVLTDPERTALLAQWHRALDLATSSL